MSPLMGELSAASALSNNHDQMPQIIVVGGTGYVGAALCNFLLERGHPVSATSRSDRPIFESPAIGRARLDVTKLADTALLPQSTTAIICPWVTDPRGAESSWIGSLLERLAGSGTRSVIYFSSMWVYGNPVEGTLTESTSTSQEDPYGSAHLANEFVLTDCAQELGLDVSILRMANLIGPDPFYRSRSKVPFTHELMEMAIRDKVVVLRSPPSTPRNLLTRTLLHHDLEALLDRTTERGRVNTFNMGSGSTTTIVELAGHVAQLVEGYDGSPVRVEHPGEPVAQPTFHLDTTRIRQLAGPGIDNLTAELELVLRDIIRSHEPDTRTREP